MDTKCPKTQKTPGPLIAQLSAKIISNLQIVTHSNYIPSTYAPSRVHSKSHLYPERGGPICWFSALLLFDICSRKTRGRHIKNPKTKLYRCESVSFLSLVLCLCDLGGRGSIEVPGYRAGAESKDRRAHAPVFGDRRRPLWVHKATDSTTISDIQCMRRRPL